MRGAGRLRRWARRLRNTLWPGTWILLYHRVIDLPADPQLLAVTPGHFAEHMEVLRQKFRPLALRDLSAAFQKGEERRRGVAVTFDDGYADNLELAKPILNRFDVPATVFVSTGCVDGQREFWWDELERLLLCPARLPARLELEIQGTAHRWELGEETPEGPPKNKFPVWTPPTPPFSSGGETGREDAVFLPPLKRGGRGGRRKGSYLAGHGTKPATAPEGQWNVEATQAPSPRQLLYLDLARLLRPLSGAARRAALDLLRAWAGEDAAPRPTHRPLTPAEVAKLGEDGSIEVGAHTLTHPVLAARSPQEQCAEITGSRARLGELLGRPVDGFAYPYGGLDDFTSRTVHLVREAGFKYACANYRSHVRRQTDPFQWPRMLVRDWDGDEFARRLEAYGHE